jgi:hypothetical protein
MKKYLLGFAAIIIAIAFSALNKPSSFEDFYLLNDPVSANIVNDPGQWVTPDEGGSVFGDCSTSPEDIACTISVQTPLSCYYHTGPNGGKILNTFAYASTQTPKQCYLEITETVGQNPCRIITTIIPKKWDPTANGGAGAYVTDTSVTVGVEIVKKNGKK